LNNISHIADRVMPAAQNNFSLHKLDYDTSDIIKLLIEAHKRSLSDTAALSRVIKATGQTDYTRKLYDLVKQNVAYRLDPDGAQFVKSPAQVWKDKFSDCKSYSLFIATTLHNAGIPFKYRFVSFNGSQVPTHVYVIVPKTSGGYITLDAVMPGYNQEKLFTFKKDIDMKGLYYVSGIGEVKRRRAPSPENRRGLNKRIPGSKGSHRVNRLRKPIPLKFDMRGKNIADLTSGEMDLLIARDRLATSKSISDNIRGIGSMLGEKYQDSIDMIDEALDTIDDHKMGRIGAIDMEEELADIADDAVTGKYSLHRRMQGIGSLQERDQIRIAGKTERKKRKAEKRAIKKKYSGKEEKKQLKAFRASSGTKTGKFLRKAGKAVVKSVKAVTKVATLPMRMAIKATLEVSLPKAAPMFLYLFINDKALIEKMPTKARNKRKKAELLANFIVEGIGMKRDHFMGIVRNGIMKHYGKSPENVIADQMKGKLSGIGFANLIGTAVSVLVKLIGGIAKLFKGKKAPKVSKDDAPDASDWGSLAAGTVTALASGVKNQPENASQTTEQMTSETTQSGRAGTETTQGSGAGTGTSDDNQYESGGRSIWDSLKS
jgi:hypothetical protein